MKKLLTVIAILISISSYAQFGFNYDPTDSSWTNYGGWSFKKMYVQKDATANPNSDYFKFYNKIVSFSILTKGVNNGSPDNIIWAGDSGLVKRSPITAIGISFKQITDGLGYVPLSVSGSGGLTSVGLNSSTLSITGSPLTSNGNITVNTKAATYNYSVTRIVSSTGISFIPSTTQPYRVYYNIEIACTASIGSASAGSVILQYFNGSIWINSPGAIKNSNTVTLAVTLNSITIQGGVVSGEFPANTPIRLLSTSTGTTTITYNTGLEILY